MNTTSNGTPDLSELLAHLSGIRKQVETWVSEDPKNRFGCYPVQEVEFWAEMGITTVAQFEHYSLVGQVSDAHKSAFGFKPHWGRLMAMSDADLKKELNACDRQLEAQREIIREHRIWRKLRKAQNKAAASVPAPIPVPAPKWTIGDLCPQLS